MKESVHMEKKIDFSRYYAIALGGGGAKGGYEIGVWRSLMEEGLKYNAVSGTSVGALNGALMTMHELEKAEELWRNIRFSDVMDVDDEEMGRFYDKEVSTIKKGSFIKRAFNIMKGGGFDVTPLRNLISKYIDAEKIKASDVDFYVVTYSLTDKKEVNVAVKTLPPDDIRDMLLASAYFPAFKNEPLLGGKRFTDGGVTDSLPVTPLINNGYRNIIAVRLTGGIGWEKRVRPRKDVALHYIEPKRKLGSTLNFSPAQAKYNMDLGYFDAKRFVYGLAGDFYYLERTLNEKQAYNELMKIIGPNFGSSDEPVSLRTMHETVIPKIAKEHGATGDYYDVFIHYLEHSAQVFKIPEFRIMKDTDLLNEVKSSMVKFGMGKF